MVAPRADPGGPSVVFESLQGPRPGVRSVCSGGLDISVPSPSVRALSGDFGGSAAWRQFDGARFIAPRQMLDQLNRRRRRRYDHREQTAPRGAGGETCVVVLKLPCGCCAHIVSCASSRARSIVRECSNAEDHSIAPRSGCSAPGVEGSCGPRRIVAFGLRTGGASPHRSEHNFGANGRSTEAP